MSKKHRAKIEQHHARAFGWDWAIPGWLSCLLICVAGMLVYSNTFQSSFHFDDQTSILHNVAIRNLSDLKTIFSFSPSRFVTYLSFGLNYTAGGVDVIGYHIANLAIHLLAALMVWLLARQVLRMSTMRQSGIAKAASLVPLLAGLIFVAHPVQTQAVTYIAQRAALLATLFYLLSLYLYGEGRRRQIANTSIGVIAGCYAAAFTAAVLGALSKETVLSLPFAVVLYEIFFFREARKTNWVIIGLASAVVLVIPLFLLSRGLISLTVTGALPAAQYLLTQPRVWLTYLRLLILPVNQNLDYDFALSRTLLDVSTLSSVAALAGIAFAGFKFFRTSRILSFSIFWFIITLLPESSFLPLPDVIYEHRLYLPMAGISLFVASALQHITHKWGTGGVAALVIGIVGALGLTAFERNKIWSNEVTLWQDVIKKSPGKARGYLNLGHAYDDLEMYKQAQAYYDMAQAIDPGYADTYASRANMLVHQGLADAAIAECNRALGLSSGFGLQLSRIYFNRGTAYLFKNLPDSAYADLCKALSYDPDLEQAYFNRAIVLARRSEFQKAIDDYSRSLALEPKKSNTFNNRGVLLRDLGRLDEALADFNNALRFNSNFPEAYFNRALTFGMKGEFDKGIEDYTSFIQLVPQAPEGYYGRGVMLLGKGEYGKALTEFSRALQINSSFGPAYAERAKAFSAMGDKAAAASDLKLAKAFGGVPVDLP
jgi:tetratricopeptide (TPR) repeat protein